MRNGASGFRGHYSRFYYEVDAANGYGRTT
jgi:hypothetical protein